MNHRNPLWGKLLLACVMGLLAGCAGTPRDTGKPVSGGSYAFWPPFPSEPHVQFARAIGSSGDLAPRQTSKLDEIVFGKDVDKAQEIAKPYGVAMRDGRVYVCDMRGSALVVLDLRKKQTRLVGVTGANHLEHPVAVTLADDGTIYVAENQRGAVMMFDAAEHYQGTIGFQGFKPVSLATFGDRLYVCDLASQSVLIFNRKTGQREGSIGTVGDEDGQFRVPLGIAADAQGNVYVSDMMRCRVQKFSPDGKLLLATGSQGDTTGSFARPKQIAVDRDGIVYVIDAAFQNVQMFDDQFQVLMHFGAAGSFPGAMNMPAGICVSDEGLELFQDRVHPGFRAKRVIAVTNQFGPDKVSLYVLGERRPEVSLAELNASAAKVDLGMGEPTAELQRIQSPGGVELGMPGAPTGVEAPPSPPADQPPAPAPTTPETKPAPPVKDAPPATVPPAAPDPK